MSNNNQNNKPQTQEVKSVLPSNVTPEIAELVKSLMSANAALIVEGIRAGAPAPAPMHPASIARQQSTQALNAPECHECRQKVHMCKGEHESIVVYPERRPEWASYFQGVSINGVRYLSTFPGESVVVSKCIVDNIKVEVQNFETSMMMATTKRNHLSLSPQQRQAALRMGLPLE